MNLIDLDNIADDLVSPNSKPYTVNGSYKYYHYNCDGFNDIGWGCGYRTLQTICSWIRERLLEKQNTPTNTINIAPVPSLIEIQKILHKCDDKPANFINSKQWIGCFEASIVIDYLYDIPCKIVHCSQGSLKENINEIINHFKNNKYPSPIMMGGDLDSGSKGILGVLEQEKSKDHFFLIADPHFYSLNDENITKSQLIQNEWLKWKQLSQIENSNSFYNFCIPQFKN